MGSGWAGRTVVSHRKSLLSNMFTTRLRGRTAGATTATSNPAYHASYGRGTISIPMPYYLCPAVPPILSALQYAQAAEPDTRQLRWHARLFRLPTRCRSPTAPASQRLRRPNGPGNRRLPSSFRGRPLWVPVLAEFGCGLLWSGSRSTMTRTCPTGRPEQQRAVGPTGWAIS